MNKDNEARLVFKNAGNGNVAMVFRAYNEAAAFRYELLGTGSAANVFMVKFPHASLTGTLPWKTPWRVAMVKQTTTVQSGTPLPIAVNSNGGFAFKIPAAYDATVSLQSAYAPRNAGGSRFGKSDCALPCFSGHDLRGRYLPKGVMKSVTPRTGVDSREIRANSK